MTDKPGQISLSTNKARKKLILGCTTSGDKGCAYHYANRMP